jgi:transposase
MKGKSLSVKVVNSQAAGIDMGNRSHFVAIGQDDEQVS